MRPCKTRGVDSEIKQAAYAADHDHSASGALYRRLFETAQDGILIIDADTGRITDVNPFLANMLGCARKDFIGKAVWRFGSFKDIRASKSAFGDLIRNGYIRYEHSEGGMNLKTTDINPLIETLGIKSLAGGQ